MKFEIKKEEPKYAVKCIRFPESLVEKIKKEAEKNDITFSKFVVEACLFALKNMDE